MMTGLLKWASNIVQGYQRKGVSAVAANTPLWDCLSVSEDAKEALRGIFTAQGCYGRDSPQYKEAEQRYHALPQNTKDTIWFELRNKTYWDLLPPLRNIFEVSPVFDGIVTQVEWGSLSIPLDARYALREISALLQCHFERCSPQFKQAEARFKALPQETKDAIWLELRKKTYWQTVPSLRRLYESLSHYGRLAQG